MVIVKPSISIISAKDPTLIMQRIEAAGRTCYKSEAKITETSNEDFVRNIIKCGHESVLEHESISVRIICDRGVSHELVRHRIASFSQESTRYCNYNKESDIAFILPLWLADENLESRYKLVWKDSADLPEIEPSCMGLRAETKIWIHSMLQAEYGYQLLIGMSQTPQQARAVLPNSLKTEVVMTANLREWRHFLKLRDSDAAHPQMREIAKMIHQQFTDALPIIFPEVL